MRLLMWLALFALVVAPPAVAWGQHCHIDSGAPVATTEIATRPTVTLTNRVTVGAARVLELSTGMDVTRGYRGDDMSVAVDWARWHASLGLGAYSVDDAGVGIDDLRGAIAITVTPARAPVATRVLASASLPTGSATAGRGMGHVMAAAGVAGVWSGRRLSIDATAVYARALGDGAEHATHAHGAELWPLVDPMNAHELVAHLGITAKLGQQGWAVRVGGDWGEPIAHGVRRAAGALGVGFARGRYHAAIELGAPLIGNAYLARGQFSVGARL